MFTLRQRQFNFISVLFINIYYYMYVYIAKKLHNNISLHAIFACNLLLLIHLICPANDIYTHTHTHTAKPSGQAYCWPINAQQTFVHMTRQEYLFNWWQKGHIRKIMPRTTEFIFIAKSIKMSSRCKFVCMCAQAKSNNIWHKSFQRMFCKR